MAAQPSIRSRGRRRARYARGFGVAGFAAAGIALGTIGGTATIRTMKPQAPSLFAPAIVTSAVPDPSFGSEAERGRQWAAMAFPAGIRDCADPTPEFLRGCEARMAEEVAAAEALAKWRAEQAPRYAATDAYPVIWDEPAPAPAEPSWAELRSRQVDQRDCRDECVPADAGTRSDAGSGAPASAGTQPVSAPAAWRTLAEPSGEGILFAPPEPAELPALSSSE